MAAINCRDHMKTKECDFYKARIKAWSSWRTIHKIRGKLNPRQLKRFEDMCFGHFLRVHDLQFSAQLCHHILLREVDHKTNSEEMWFYIGGDDISRFSIVEFCLVTGLRYSKTKESSHKIDERLEERIRRIHFNSAMKITVQTLESYFDDYVSMDEEDDDIVKLALLLFLEVTLMGKDERHPVDYVYMQSVDNLDAFNALPWGSSIYKRLFDSLLKCCKGRSEKFKKKRKEKPSHKEERYNIYGFVYAFQVWAYETVPSYAEKNYAKRISKEIPRILSWEAVKIPTFDDLRNEIFSRQAVPPLHVLKPTEEERQQSFFTELLEHDVPSQDDLVKGVDDLSSEISSLRVEVVAQQEEITAPENVIIAPQDDKENDHGLREGECEVHDEVSEIAQNPVLWPSGGQLTFDWIRSLTSIFNWSSKNIPPHSFPSVFPLAVFDNLVSIASKILRKEPNCVKIDGLHQDSTIVVVGDIHGQLHDLLFLLRDAGFPSEGRFFIFNGDYVDRGAWGLETFLLLLAWKVFLPHRVCLLRGNHETKYCTSVYGFKKEVLTKYGDEGMYAYQKCLNCFKELPLASIIAGKVYTAHGGLFRSIPVTHSKRSKGKKKRNISSSSEASSLSIGTLEQLFKAQRSVLDHPGEGSNLIPSDVLWSDPSSNKKSGLSLNEDRCIGLLWGPDCTENFLKNSNLKLIIRSHEGPDARDKRPDMEGMDNGFTIDHCVASGKLITLFSAPDYPQFQATEDRYNNKGAYVVLRSPNFDEPEFHIFKAVTPRPKEFGLNLLVLVMPECLQCQPDRRGSASRRKHYASSCNRKVIGARYYTSGYEAEEDMVEKVSFRSPRDSAGHGSHTASTAAGCYVTNMNYKELAAGGARGGAPMARIAVYKACWDSSCYDVDLLAAFDDAIRDGVQILSLSLGPDAPQGDYFNDAISIGSLHAVSRGILVVASVGNEGNQGSATNLAPWMFSVAASSTDRDFTSNIVLGNSANFTGESLSLFGISASARIISASEANA